MYFDGNPVTGFNAAQYGVLAFGTLRHDTHPDANDCLAGSGMIQATRTSTTTWTLESVGGCACQFARDDRDIECQDTDECSPELVPFALRFDIEVQ